MKRLIIPFMILLFISACADDQPVVPSERIDLFNGHDLSGWVVYHRSDEIDPAAIWSVRDGVIHCQGDVFGYMRTERKYADYSLTVDWRWVEEPFNSGVLIHITGADSIWPTSFEIRLKHGDAGDVSALGGSSSRQSRELEAVRVPRVNPSSEHLAGEWNTTTIVCRNDTVEVTVNCVFQNRIDKVDVQSGYIGLQSEGAPIQFRNVLLEPLD